MMPTLSCGCCADAALNDDMTMASARAQWSVAFIGLSTVATSCQLVAVADFFGKLAACRTNGRRRSFVLTSIDCKPQLRRGDFSKGASGGVNLLDGRKVAQAQAERAAG